MSKVSRDVEAFLDYYHEMWKVMDSEADWETKYDFVFSLAREMDDLPFRIDYYDPDTSYEEDVRACFNAYTEKAEQLAKAFGISLDPEER